VCWGLGGTQATASRMLSQVHSRRGLLYEGLTATTRLPGQHPPFLSHLVVSTSRRHCSPMPGEGSTTSQGSPQGLKPTYTASPASLDTEKAM
jgi:hypothetical protein